MILAKIMQECKKSSRESKNALLTKEKIRYMIPCKIKD